MDNIATMSMKERRELFALTAQKMPYLSEAAIEKDFWVCWILKQIFSSKLRNTVIFKGGTSLSKIFHLIKRFSEDIDLILNWENNPIGNPSEPRSNAKQAKFNLDLDEWGNHYIAHVLLPEIQVLCGRICYAEIQPDKPENIIITYPRAFKDPYLRPQILLEIGVKAAWVPHAQYEITPYSAEAYPRLFTCSSAEITATTPERSFWEKVTILHSEAHRPENRPIRGRYSRHYYDTVMIAGSAVKAQAFADLSLLKQVVDFKDKFYHCGWANYPDAKPGTMKLLPPEHSLKPLQDDYAQMRAMIYGDDIPFDAILDSLRELEAEINRL